MRIFCSLRYVGALSLVGLVAACGDSTGPDPQPPTPTLAVVSGSGQSAAVGQAVGSPLVVRATQGGTAMSGTTISWVVTAGGGTVNPASSTTDNSGNASTTWTLGPAAGTNTVEASASGISGGPLSFTATGTAVVTPPNQVAVSVDDNFFNPSTRTVAVGGDVTWTWAGSNPHSVRFTSGTSSSTQTAGTFLRSFPTAGTFGYDCAVHGASMSGTIIVQ